jgi:hypothetical protein
MVTDFTITLVNDVIAGKADEQSGDYYPANLLSRMGSSLS